MERTIETYLVDFFTATDRLSSTGSQSFSTEAQARRAVAQAEGQGFAATIYHEGYFYDSRRKA